MGSYYITTPSRTTHSRVDSKKRPGLCFFAKAPSKVVVCVLLQLKITCRLSPRSITAH